MNNTQTPNEGNDDLLSEYNFDYKKARPNRFAEQTYKSVTITLDADVAKVFKTSEDVNNALRALLSAIPQANK